MAYPSDPRIPPEVNAALARPRLTPEEADRLAAMFRPSWETDEAPPAPAVVPGSALAVPALNGTHVGPHVPAHSAVPVQEPVSSVIVDSSDILPSSVDAAAQARARAAQTLVLPKPLGGSGLRIASPATTARTVPFAAAGRIATPLEMAEFVEPDFAKPARKLGVGVWAGIGVAAAAVIGIGVWLGSGSDEKRPAPTVLPERPHVAPAIPPPPPAAETVASQPPQTATASPPPAPPPPPAPVAASPPAAAQAPATLAQSPQPASPPAAAPAHLFVPPAPQRPTWVPPPAKAAAAAPPPARPKPATPTIVRDVPF